MPTLRDVARFRITTKPLKHTHCKVRYGALKNQEWLDHIIDCEECREHPDTRERILTIVEKAIRHGCGQDLSKQIAMTTYKKISTKLLASTLLRRRPDLKVRDLKKLPMAEMTR